ncbi:MAG TPA: GDP-L-fucose synthase [Gemmatimonadales bacterium]|nr:GDP-L-fucose synthase [Gemmatimonadales bacterium]
MTTDFWRGRRVLLTGATGFVGRNLVPLLRETGCTLITPTRAEFDLQEQDAVRRMFREHRPEIVLHLAALSGGIMANKEKPADYCYQNLFMGTTMLHESFKAGVKKYVTLIGGCSYPATAPNPISETEMWNGYPQPESAPYSIAKKMSIVQAEAYRRQHGFDAVVLVPGNLYGPWDNFDLQASHVIPALVRKYHEAKLAGSPEVVAWGTGKPVRDFIYVGDACEAIVRATERYSGADIINISCGQPVTIRELVETVAELTGYSGTVRWDSTKPDGQMFKGFDVTRMREWLGYTPRTSLREGLQKTIAWFEANHAAARLAVTL